MQHLLKILFPILALGLVCRADVIVNTPNVSGGGAFQNFPADFLTVGENGNPYWANPSIDGPRLGVGYFLTDKGWVRPGQPPGLTSPNWYGRADGSPASSFYFASSTPMELTLVLTFTANVLEFGWYDVRDPATPHALFTTASPASSTMPFFPGLGVNYSFYVHYLPGTSGNPTDTYYTQQELNSAGPGTERSYYGTRQHFVVFASSLVPNQERYYIGLEDQFGVYAPERQGDYQDMVIRLQAVPEPATTPMLLVAFLVGVLCLAAKFRRGHLHRRKPD